MRFLREIELSNRCFHMKGNAMKKAVFAAMYCHCPILKNYEDPSIPEEDRNRSYPMVLIIYRWDNKIGFPGGFVNEGESELDALVREVNEEVNIELINHENSETEKQNHIISDVEITTYPIYLGEITFDTAILVHANSTEAKHFLSEGVLFWANMYGPKFENLLNANNLMPFVKEDLISLRNRIFIP